VWQEPFQHNDIRVVECLVALDPSSNLPRMGQRMKVTLRPD
jgi:hypothetical protein